MKFNRIRFNKRSVIVTWLTSYISVLLVPIIISGILYAASWHVVESEVNRANNNALKQMELAIDNSLGGIERLSLEISLNKQVNAFINTSQPLTDNDYYDLVTISNDLRVYQTANEFIEQIYLYYKIVILSYPRAIGRIVASYFKCWMDKPLKAMRRGRPIWINAIFRNIHGYDNGR